MDSLKYMVDFKILKKSLVKDSKLKSNSDKLRRTKSMIWSRMLDLEKVSSSIYNNLTVLWNHLVLKNSDPTSVKRNTPLRFTTKYISLIS